MHHDIKTSYLNWKELERHFWRIVVGKMAQKQTIVVADVLRILVSLKFRKL